MDYRKLVASRIQQLMNEKNWTKLDLANASGITRQQLDKVLKRKVSLGLDILVGIAASLEVPPHKLLEVESLQDKADVLLKSAGMISAFIKRNSKSKVERVLSDFAKAIS